MKEIFLATREIEALLANYRIMLGISIQYFRHLDSKYQSIISDFIDRRKGKQIQQWDK